MMGKDTDLKGKFQQGDEKMLVSPKAYDLDVEAFRKFLDAGGEAYTKK